MGRVHLRPGDTHRHSGAHYSSALVPPGSPVPADRQPGQPWPQCGQQQAGQFQAGASQGVPAVLASPCVPPSGAAPVCLSHTQRSCSSLQSGARLKHACLHCTPCRNSWAAPRAFLSPTPVQNRWASLSLVPQQLLAHCTAHQLALAFINCSDLRRSTGCNLLQLPIPLAPVDCPRGGRKRKERTSDTHAVPDSRTLRIRETHSASVIQLQAC